MKTFVLTFCAVICFVLIQVNATPAHGPSFSDIHNACQSNPATHVDESVFRAIHNGESYDRALVGAHMLCMTTRFGTQNADGSINRDRVRSAFANEINDESKVDELTNQCSNIHESTPGEAALSLTKCIRDNLPSARRRAEEHGHHHHH